MLDKTAFIEAKVWRRFLPVNRAFRKATGFAVAVALFASLTGCGQGQNQQANGPSSPPKESAEKTQQPAETAKKAKTTMRVGALKGPTGMGMAQLMEQDAQGAAALEYDFTVLDSPDDLTGKIINGEVDAAAIPTNAALALYNKTNGAVQLAAVNTLGVLFVLENGDAIRSIADLKGKTVHTGGKGATQDFAFRYILQKNGLDPDKDVTLDYKLQHADLAAAAAAGDAKIALLPQPHVTTAMMKNPQLRIALDVTKEWEKAAGDAGKLAMGCIVVQKKFAQANKEALGAFLDEYKQSIAFVNGQADQASELIAKYAILPNANVAKKAIPLSNIVYIDAQEAKSFLEKFYKVLYDFEPKSVGGKLADEGFYYSR